MEQIAALREQWLAQLAEAIESAQRLAWQLGTREDNSKQTRELYDRLEAARTELETLRGLLLRPASFSEPDWLREVGWIGTLPDRADDSSDG